MKYLPLLLLVLVSCSSKKDVLLIQDTEITKNYLISYEEIKIKPDDILRVKISTKSHELAELFSFYQSQNISNTLESYQIDGYVVNSEGFVNIPSLGPIMVSGLTLSDASTLIQKYLIENEDLKNASVDVKILNSYFTILGEVKMPGRYNFLQNNMDIFQALGIAGDLTINGKRDDIKILRKINNNLSVSSLDITSSNIFNSGNIQIFPGDIIIVNPNNARVKNAGIIGNSGNLLSVLSFILSSIILITSSN